MTSPHFPEREVLHDGCLKQVWRKTGETAQHTRGKRRPAAVKDHPEWCSWVIFCPDHPNKTEVHR